jgi:terminase small subunit-like protein
MPMPPVAQDKINAYGLDAVCDDILNGLALRTIAKNLGVDIAQLCRWKAQPQHSARVTEALAATAEYWDQVAVDGIAQARDAFELAKARELAHHYRWRASKIAPKLYGDRQQVEGKFTVDWAQVCQESVEKYKQKHGGS